MTNDEIRTTVVQLLTDIAPEIDAVRIQPDKSLRDQLDVDSIDLLNFMIAIHKAFNVEIPERDYPKLMTLNGCVGYLENALRSKK